MYLDKIKQFLKKLNIKTLVFVYILLMSVTPIIPRLTSMYLTTYFYMIVVTVSVLFTFFSCGLDRIKEYVVYLLPFIVYEMAAMLVSNNPDVLLAGYQVLLFLLPVCIGFYLATHRFFVDFFAVFLILAVCVTCMTTIIGCIAHPDAARVLATTKSSQDPLAILYEMQNIGGYGFVYSTVLLYPFVILAYKMKKLHPLFVIILTAILAFMTIQAEYTFAILLMMLSSLLFFVRRDIPVKKFFIMLAGFVLIVLLFRATIAAILTYIGNALDNQAMVEKINAAFLGTDSVEGFDDDRGALYLLSIQVFLKNPLFGTMFMSHKPHNGGHSFILDNLAMYGLFGAALMIFMYRALFKLFIKPMKDKPGYAFVVWAFIQPIILSSINTGMWLQNFCLYTPIFLCAIYGSEVYLNVVRPQPKPAIPVNVLKRKDY